MAGWGSPSWTALVMCWLAGALASCQTAGSPAGRPIAFETIDGPPPEMRGVLNQELSTAAYERRIEIVPAGAQPRYRIKGYLTTERTPDGGTALAFVWDVFDADQRRARRVIGSAPIGAASAKSPAKNARNNPWDGLDKEALARLAARSMDEIATFLAAGPGAAPSPEPAEEPASES